MSAMKPHPDCPVDHDGDRALIACLTDRVDELEAALDQLRAPVRLVQALYGKASILAVDDQGRLWEGWPVAPAGAMRWDRLAGPCPSDTLDTPPTAP